MKGSALEYLVHGVARPVQGQPGELQVGGGDGAYHSPVVVVVAASVAHMTRWFRRY